MDDQPDTSGTEEIIDPSIVQAQAETLDSPLLIEQAYNSLVYAEQRHPQPQDSFRVRVEPGSIEFQRLTDGGVDSESLSRGILTRQELQDAGFAFVNSIGNGEKGLMSGEVTDVDSGETIDFTGRTLLTEQELGLIYRHQQAQPQTYGLQDQDVDVVRQDMMSFLLAATSPEVFETNYDVIGRVPMGPHDYEARNIGMVDQWVGQDGEWEVVETFWKDRISAYERDHPDSQGYRSVNAVKEAFIREHCGDLYTWKESSEPGGGAFMARQVRGVPTHNLMMMRQGALQGQLSPFLDRGYVFGANLDVNVHLDGVPDLRSPGQQRMNIATIHLAGGHSRYPGLSEMGGQAADQQYMPTGTFVNRLFVVDPDERQRVQTEESAIAENANSAHLVAEIHRRLLEVAQAEYA